MNRLRLPIAVNFDCAELSHIFGVQNLHPFTIFIFRSRSRAKALSLLELTFSFVVYVNLILVEIYFEKEKNQLGIQIEVGILFKVKVVKMCIAAIIDFIQFIVLIKVVFITVTTNL